MLQVSAARSLGDSRAQFALGRLTAHSPWRAQCRDISEIDRENSLRLLMREAEEYGADGVVDLAFAVEECAGFECLGPKLRRVVATGRAVRLAMAA